MARKPRRSSKTTTRKSPRVISAARDPVARYAEAVAGGKIVAGPLVRLAGERHLRDLAEGHKRGLRWDTDAADRVVGFFADVLCLAEGEHAGQPFILQPWQQFIVGSLFGWKSRDGFRRFRLAYCEVGKGNGKSPLAGGVGLYMMVSDGEVGAHCYAAAVTRDQAGIMFADAVNMVDKSPQLARRIQKSGKRVVYNLAHVQSGSFFRPVSSEGRGLDGKRVAYAGIDEIHEHRTPIVVQKMRAGTKGRRQALILEITNSGSDRKSICWEHHAYAERILRGIEENDAFFGYVCALDPGDDWRDEKVWLKANPNLGVSVTRKYLREQVAEAEGMPANQGIVRRLNFCEWTEAADAWIDHDTWEAVQDDDLRLDQFRGLRCWGGLDLSGKNDLTSLFLCFEHGDGFALFGFYWTPTVTLAARERTDKVPYKRWRDAGYLTAVPGRSIDYAVVAERIGQLAREHEIAEIAFDRYRIDDLLREFDDLGVEAVIVREGEETPLFGGLRLIPHGQGFKDMGPAVDAIDSEIRNRRARFARNPVTTMCAANAVLVTDPAENKKFDKRTATGRIDGIVAATQAMRRATMARDDGAKLAGWLEDAVAALAATKGGQPA